MNREIKFRAWDTQNEEFSSYTNRDPHFDVTTGRIFFWERTRKEDGSYGGDIILEDLGERFVLEQFTGIMDKNGKEIYEGDVVKLFNDEDEHYEVVYNCFDHDILGFILEGQGGRGDWFASKDREVVGNIRENPELL